MKQVALTAAALLIAIPAYAEPLIIDGCSVVETFVHVDRTASGDERHSTTVVCYGDTATPSIRKANSSLITTSPPVNFCAGPTGIIGTCR